MGLPLKEEAWIWYSLVIFVAAARYASRILLFRGDLRKLQIDDFIIAVALCSYTTLIVTINIVAFTESNLLPPGFSEKDLTPDDIAERRFGSKLVLVVEQCQCVTIWAVKVGTPLRNWTRTRPDVIGNHRRQPSFRRALQPHTHLRLKNLC